MSSSPRKKETAARNSALAIDRALGHLNGAIAELDRAHANASKRGARLDSSAEHGLHTRLSNALLALEGPGLASLLTQIRQIRDRRANQAGFEFNKEG